MTENHHDFEKYTKIIEYKNTEIAHLYMLQRKEGIFPKWGDLFYEEMEKQFIKNKDSILKDLEKRSLSSPVPKKIGTGMYDMNVTIDYVSLYNMYSTECTEREQKK